MAKSFNNNKESSIYKATEEKGPEKEINSNYGLKILNLWVEKECKLSEVVF